MRGEGIVPLAVLVAGALGWGWWHRDASPIDPHVGLGYALGITGGTMMLTTLGFAAAKRFGRRGEDHATRGWYRVHVVLGLLGPLAILYHARFHWGALNSSFALATMLVVTLSGLVGRFAATRSAGPVGRVLALWHFLHLPLFGLLVVAALLHVLMVHWY